jgi:hypothetical protein
LLSVNPTAVPTLAPTAAYYLTTESYKVDGSLFAWGEAPYGGGLADVYSQTRSSIAQQVVASRFAFTALKSDGSLVVWGAPGNTEGAKLVRAFFNMVVGNGTRTL